MITVEDIKREITLYSKTILFFACFYKHLKSRGIRVEVEQKLKNKIPDFIIYKKNDITTIIEHKASLPYNKEHALKTIREVYNKYSNLSNINYDIAILCPVTVEKVLKEIKEDILDTIVLIFDLNQEEGKISISKFVGNINDIKLNEAIDIDISCNREDFSRFKFIRKPPPNPIYTAYFLWNVVFNAFKEPEYYTEESFEIKYENIVREANTFYPEWIKNKSQVSKGEINKALDFLKKIGFIKWNREKEKITIFHKRGTRIGDIIEYFAKKYVKFKEKEVKKSKLKPGQLSLDRWFF